MSNKEKVIELSKADPSMSGAAIGRLLGITREAVRQIRDEAGIVKKRNRCLDCGERIGKPHSRCWRCFQKRLNEQCHIVTVCPYCGWKFMSLKIAKRKFCSYSCAAKYRWQHNGGFISGKGR